MSFTVDTSTSIWQLRLVLGDINPDNAIFQDEELIAIQGLRPSQDAQLAECWRQIASSHMKLIKAYRMVMTPSLGDLNQARAQALQTAEAFESAADGAEDLPADGDWSGGDNPEYQTLINIRRRLF